MSYFLSGLKLEHLVLALTLQTASVGTTSAARAQGPLAGTRSSGTSDWDFRPAIQPKTCSMLQQLLLVVNWPYRSEVTTRTGLHFLVVT